MEASALFLLDNFANYQDKTYQHVLLHHPVYIFSGFLQLAALQIETESLIWFSDCKIRYQL